MPKLMPPKIQAAVERLMDDIRDFEAGKYTIIGKSSYDVIRSILKDFSANHLAPAIAELVRDVRIEDAKAVCINCSIDEKLSLEPFLGWMHPDLGSETFKCKSGNIHDLLALAKEEKDG